MTNEEVFITRIKKNVSKLVEIKESDIQEQIEKFKAASFDLLKDLFELNDRVIDWIIVEKRVLEQVQVTHEKGFGIIDDDRNYDIAWFSDHERMNGLQYYWKRFIEKQTEKLPPNVIKTVKDDTESILNRCGSPERKEVKDIRGLVFGNVQSGKTLNYTSVANAAMDTGYDIIIILAGATKVLRKQTQERVNSDVIGWNGFEAIGVGNVIDKMSKRPISLTTLDGDFISKIADQLLQGVNLSNVNTPVIAVLKKNVSPLKNLNKWLKIQNKTGRIKKSILLIDDESDYASVNTKKNGEDPTAINKGLRQMLNHFEVSTYLAITATPFANVLINYQNSHDDYGEDLFPRSFIWSLNKPSTYAGVEEIVLDRFKNLYDCQSYLSTSERKQECSYLLKKGAKEGFEELPYFFDDALSEFFVSLIKLRKERPDQDDVSMMINISRYTRHHEDIAGLLELTKHKLIDNIRSLSPSQFTHPILKRITSLGEDLMNEGGRDEFWKDVLTQLLSTQIVGVHMNTKNELEFSKGKKLNFILVGGLSLSRGFTIEGLITSVFLRSTRTYDALMQMGRWFGHKKHILPYVSLFTTPEIQIRYEIIEEATNDLLKQIETMRARKETPREFGLGVKYDPLAALQVVAYNKGRDSAKLKVSFGMNGRCCETTKLYEEKHIVAENRRTVAKFISRCNTAETSLKDRKDLYFAGNNNEISYDRVNSKSVVDFLHEFKVPGKEITQLSQKLPYPFLIEYLSTKTDFVDVVLVQGEYEHKLDIGKAEAVVPNRRKFEERAGWIQQVKNQISKPTDEAILLSKAALKNSGKSKRSELRKLRQAERSRPLLLIYPLMVHFEHSNDFHENYAWSLTTPGEHHDEKGKLVYANQVLVDMLESGDETFFIDNESDEES